jgi:hypothetical protein
LYPGRLHARLRDAADRDKHPRGRGNAGSDGDAASAHDATDEHSRAYEHYTPDEHDGTERDADEYTAGPGCGSCSDGSAGGPRPAGDRYGYGRQRF